MNGYWHPDLDVARLRFNMGMDSCADREILRTYGGPNYWHLQGCGCSLNDVFGGVSDILGGNVTPW